MPGSERSEERIVGEPAELGAALAARLATESARALAARGRFTLALPGGSAAELLLPRLAGAALDLERLEVFWVDERAVPATSPDSNSALARRLWLDPAGVPREGIHPMPAEGADLDHAAADYAALLRRRTGDPPRLDVVLLGVGADGHVASLFPGSAALEQSERTVLAVRDAPKPPPRRLTLALPVLAAAGLVVVAAFGDGKAAAIGAALDDPASELPVARLRRLARRRLFLLDPAAARLARSLVR